MLWWVTTAGYLAILVGMGLTELFARWRPNRVAPLADMLDHVMRLRTTRVGIIAAWWWFGWHFLFAPTIQVAI
jgi:hypothetical protein